MLSLFDLGSPGYYFSLSDKGVRERRKVVGTGDRGRHELKAVTLEVIPGTWAL